MIKRAIRKAFNTAGYEIHRKGSCIPPPPPEPRTPLYVDPAIEFDWLKQLNIKSVLDVGANTGQFASKIRGILPDVNIYSFEPLADSYAELVSVTANWERFTAFNFALGSEETETTIYRSESSPSSSILPMCALHKEAFPHTKDFTRQVIRVKPLDRLNLLLEDNLLVKIDVQGYEEQVIAGGRRTINRAKLAIVETSFEVLYEGQPLFASIYDAFCRMGFAYHGNLEQLRSPLDGNILQADSIFIKD